MNGRTLVQMARYEALNLLDPNRVEAGHSENDNGWRKRISREQPQHRPLGSRVSA